MVSLDGTDSILDINEDDLSNTGLNKTSILQWTNVTKQLLNSSSPHKHMTTRYHLTCQKCQNCPGTAAPAQDEISYPKFFIITFYFLISCQALANIFGSINVVLVPNDKFQLGLITGVSSSTSQSSPAKPLKTRNFGPIFELRKFQPKMLYNGSSSINYPTLNHHWSCLKVAK